MSDISPSRIETDAEFEQRVSRMSNFQEIRTAMHERAMEQGLVRPDNDPFILVEVNQPIPRKLAQSVELNGVRQYVEVDASEGEIGLQRAVAEFYRSHLNGSQQTQTQSRDEQGRFQSRADEPTTQVTDTQLSDKQQNQLMDMVEARAALIRGELSPESYAALVLKEQGLDPDTLREVVQERQEASEAQSWADATETFLNSPVGAGWPGGNRNRDLLVSLMMQNGLMDATDKVAALTTAYSYAKQHDLLVENDELGYKAALEKCTSQKEIDVVNATYRESLGLQTNQGKTFWGSR